MSEQRVTRREWEMLKAQDFERLEAQRDEAIARADAAERRVAELQNLVDYPLATINALEQRAARAKSAILDYARWVRAAFPPELEQSDAEQRLLDLADTLEAST